MEFVLIANPDSRRAALFQAALAQLDLPPATVVAWADLLADRAALPDRVRPGAIVRIESPGKDFAVERALLVAGAVVPDPEDHARLDADAAAALSFDKGLILYPRQWYLGFCAALQRITQQLACCPPHRLMSATEAIATQFDKGACWERLAQNRLPVPRSLGTVESYSHLVARMRETNRYQVFVKLAHSSSASGVVAYRTNGREHQAITTVEMVRQNGELRLYNSRRIRVYREVREIAELIDALCRHRVHVEEWIPKAGIDGQVFDLRVVVIGGQARHVVVRQSHSPMTNLHLLNTRGDVERVRERLGAEAWQAALQTCEQALAQFAGSFYAGLDLLITPDFRRHAILEINAFGDLLPNVFWNGQDTYAAEITAFITEVKNDAHRCKCADRHA